MTDLRHVIIGCGDVGRRIARQLINEGEAADSILAIVKTKESAAQCIALGMQVERFDFDQTGFQLSYLDHRNCYYLVPPQKSGISDLRTKAIIAALAQENINPNKLVLISTTGVYGDCQGEWVTEESKVNPQTDRGKRRLDSESRWTHWCQSRSIDCVILRVPGIYARSRIPRQRIENKIPVVDAKECGFTNRIHAEDLANVCITAMQSTQSGEVFNATDGTPGKITEYLQAAAAEMGLPMPPIISMQEAQRTLSPGMLSYLAESRKISNEKMLSKLAVSLRFLDFKEGLKFG